MILDGYKKAWVQKVTHEALPVDQGFSTTHDEKTLSTSGVDPTGEKGLSEIIIVQNKPKNLCLHRFP